MDRKERLLATCTMAIVLTLGVCTAIVHRDIRAQPEPPDLTGDLQRIVELNQSIDAKLQCVNYRLMNLGEKVNYLQLHPGESC